jgi:hypothetical protein
VITSPVMSRCGAHLIVWVLRRSLWFCFMLGYYPFATVDIAYRRPWRLVYLN